MFEVVYTIDGVQAKGMIPANNQYEILNIITNMYSKNQKVQIISIRKVN